MLSMEYMDSLCMNGAEVLMACMCSNRSAHSILHNLKVRDIIMWGNPDNTSCQSAEHGHIDFIKAVLIHQ